jgi:hypothetical protein
MKGKLWLKTNIKGRRTKKLVLFDIRDTTFVETQIRNMPKIHKNKKRENKYKENKNTYEV